MEFYTIKGFYTADSSKESGFTVVPKQQWSQYQDTNRVFSICSVQRMIQVGGLLVPIEGTEVHYLWSFNDAISHKSLNEIFAEEAYVPKVKEDKPVLDEQDPTE